MAMLHASISYCQQIIFYFLFVKRVVVVLVAVAVAVVSDILLLLCGYSTYTHRQPQWSNQ